VTNKQNADASESFRQLMAAYSKAFSSTPDSVKEEENADDTATTTENGTTPSPRTASILDADDETTETALEFNLERAKLLNRQKEQELEEQAQKIKGSVKPTLTYERGALIREEVQTFSLWPLLLNGYRYSKARGVHVQHQCSGCGS